LNAENLYRAGCCALGCSGFASREGKFMGAKSVPWEMEGVRLRKERLVVIVALPLLRLTTN